MDLGEIILSTERSTERSKMLFEDQILIQHGGEGCVCVSMCSIDLVQISTI